VRSSSWFLSDTCLHFLSSFNKSFYSTVKWILIKCVLNIDSRHFLMKKLRVNALQFNSWASNASGIKTKKFYLWSHFLVFMSTLIKICSYFFKKNNKYFCFFLEFPLILFLFYNTFISSTMHENVLHEWNFKYFF
jgi:hypothetical protein